ncbi:MULTISPECIES: hypothetical protein [unclassified Halobacterium]|uniref:hypothetical protein n=1 Tax=unclassified Halobacterium TaxID=2668073 RepID=UPI001964C484|nr:MULTISPECIES: hypothetical protein [unclassified Halobacterium]QRY22494.1 hypothetical protein JT689_10830 [Halobacterium sp. GSL-19]QRY26346.1 hypothetical protein JRZ79_13215 [Halobacterium sp. BOL4-2]
MGIDTHMANFWKTIFWLIGPAFVITFAGGSQAGFSSKGAIAPIVTIIAISYWLSKRGYHQTGISPPLLKRIAICLVPQFVAWQILSPSLGVFSRPEIVTASIILSSIGIGLLWTSYKKSKLRIPKLQRCVIIGATALPAFIIIASGVAAVNSLDPTSNLSALGLLFIFLIPSFIWVLFTEWKTKQLFKYVIGTSVAYVVLWLVLVPLTARDSPLPSVKLVLVSVIYIIPLMYLAEEAE